MVVLSLPLVGSAASLKPTVWADIPDVAPLRVGDMYYMTSTTMHFNPGIPVMASKDLVDWKIVSYCYDTIENRDEDNLANGKNDYLYGTWASSIRYNEVDGYYYVSSFNNRARHTYLFRAKSPEGPWERRIFTDRLVYDHSLWIEDGKFYFFGSDHGKVYLHKIKDDLSGLEPDPKLVCPAISNNLRGGHAEGSQVFKHGDYYYLVNICWPGGHCRLVNVHRAKTMEGPFVEARVCFEREGIAQGSFIEKADGSWVAVLFGDRGGVGRIPYVLPVEWKDDWPIVQAKDDYCATAAVPSCVASDDFASEKLKLVWQWNHNPDNANWKLADGALKITTGRVDQDLLTVRNTLTQRTFGPTSEATVKVDGSALKVGDKAGLSLFQQHWGAISLQKTEKGYDVVLDLPPLKLSERRLFRPRKDAPTREVLRRGIGATPVIYLKAVCDFTPFEHPDYRKIPDSQDTGRFYYSTDGQRWEALGEAMPMPYTVPHFTGYRYALFAWATKEAGGTASFDDFTVAPAKAGETMKMDGTNPIVKTRFTADPAGYVDGDWFYLFTGHDDASARGYRMFDYTMCRTKDMKNWEDFGPVLNLAEVFPWARADKAWASQVIKRGDKWYWYIATAHKRRRGDVIAVAVADKPQGPWKDAAGEGGLAVGHAFIDPSVFVDDDGSAWLFWGNCGGNPGCWYAKLKDSMTELDGEIKPVPGLMDPSAFGEPLVKRHGAGHRRDGSKNTNFEEAPWIYKVGDTYYLEYAAGGVPENWSYSTAKSIHGPWTYRGKIMENAGGTGTIHGGSVLFKGQWYMVYHDGNLPGGGDCRRSVCIEPYVRNPDGSIPFIKPTKEGVSVADKIAGAADRDFWVKTLVRLTEPVVTNLAAGTLRKNFPRRRGTWTDSVAELEAFGRVMTGLGPWLELPDDETDEGRLRVQVRENVIKALDNITRPGSPDRMPFEQPGQSLVDTAFLAQGLMRCRNNVWARVPETVKTNVCDCLRATRKIKPFESNWLLFASEIEAFLLEETGACDEQRLRYGIDAFMTRPGWYVGDGLYADGKDFAMDGYNSFVIQPMLWDVANVMVRRGLKDGESYLKTIRGRLHRFADLQERMIGPDGTYPLFGRSITYRFGTFQGLALAALIGPDQYPAKPGAVRAALTAVLKRQTGPENFLPGGWLRVGFNGEQPMLAERYIDFGSVYMCAAVFLPLGRPANDVFWTESASDWTQKAAWSGRPARGDHRR